MPSLVSHIYRSRGHLTRHRWHIVLLGLALGATPLTVRAQVYLSHTEDAAPVPKGVLRMKVTTGWTRFDERFTPNGPRPISDDIATDSLGTRQFPLLTPVEQGLQTLTNSPLTRLTFGHLAARENVRIVTTPVALEYGLTRRLSVGVMVPVVQTRRSMQLRMNLDATGKPSFHVFANPDGSLGGNVGWVPDRLRRQAATANGLVYSGFQRAADSLATLIAKCPSNPNAAGCALVLSNTADANAARLAAQQFAAAVKAALGTDSSTAYVAPRTGSGLANQLAAEQARLNVLVQKYLGASAGASTGVFGAVTPFSYIDLQGRDGTKGLLESPLGGGFDSIQTNNKLVLNGFTLSAQYLLLDNFRVDTFPSKGIQTRVVIGGAYRYEPIFPDSVQRLGAIPLGDGNGIELRSAMDVIVGSFGGTVAARFVKSLSRTLDGPVMGDPDAFWIAPAFGPVTSTAGTVVAVDFTPRILLGDWFTFDGHYGFERRGATTYDVTAATATCAFCAPFSPNIATRMSQTVGVGLRYSTADAYARGSAKTPIEVSYTHLETISGDPGVPKVWRDQVQVRVYINVRTGR
jgi:hypothetical protein